MPKHNSCKDCIFAKYDDITQTGCNLGLIEEYQKLNIPVIECYDEEKLFYVIPNRMCMSNRPQEWTFSKTGLEEQKEQIKKEVALRFLTIVIGNDDELDSIKTTVDSLVNQTLKPFFISIIRPPFAKYSIRDIAVALGTVPIQWRIQRIIDPDLDKCLWEDMEVDSIKQANFYSTFQAGFTVPPNFCEEINNKVNYQFLEFAALTENSSGNGWTVPRIVYDYFMGNKEWSLPFKLKELECPTIPVSKIVTNFPE